MGQVSSAPFEGLGQSHMLTDHAGEAELQMDEYARCADQMVIDRRRDVLDWGCGFGHLAEAIRTRGIAVTLYDYEPAVDASRELRLSRYPHLIATVSSDPVELPFEDSSFDAVVSMGTLEHVERPSESLAEIRRVLRPGGYLYVFKLPNRGSYVEYIARKTGRYYHGALTHDRVYSLKSSRRLISSSGFAITEARYMNMLPLMSVSRRTPKKYLPVVNKANRGLSAVPGLNRIATNIELIAVRTDW